MQKKAFSKVYGRDFLKKQHEKTYGQLISEPNVSQRHMFYMEMKRIKDVGGGQSARSTKEAEGDENGSREYRSARIKVSEEEAADEKKLDEMENEIMDRFIKETQNLDDKRYMVHYKIQDDPRTNMKSFVNLLHQKRLINEEDTNEVKRFLDNVGNHVVAPKNTSFYRSVLKIFHFHGSTGVKNYCISSSMEQTNLLIELTNSFNSKNESGNNDSSKVQYTAPMKQLHTGIVTLLLLISDIPGLFVNINNHINILTVYKMLCARKLVIHDDLAKEMIREIEILNYCVSNNIWMRFRLEMCAIPNQSQFTYVQRLEKWFEHVKVTIIPVDVIADCLKISYNEVKGNTLLDKRLFLYELIMKKESC